MNDFSNNLPEQESLVELLDLAIGYQRAKVLFTFAELGIADLLQKKPLKADAIAQNIKMTSLAAERFLNAAVSVGLLSKNGDYYKNNRLSEQFLISDARFFLGGQIKRYSERSYPAWNDLTEHLQKWDYGNSENETPEDEDQGAEAMAEQHNLSLLHGHYLARSFDFSGYKNLLDLGGGTGAMSIGLCENYAHLKACVFDLPENIKTAREFIQQSDLKNRIECVGGDFQTDALPENFDVALLANFMSVAEVEENKKLLREIYEKLPVGGACLLSGLILDDSRLSPEKAVLFCLEDICWDAPDVERSEKVYAEWLEEAGFVDIESKNYLDATKLLCGFKRD
jgi:3-hydroxy-5-methyl-1-naphthoate 3-O-methyltransferase